LRRQHDLAPAYLFVSGRLPPQMADHSGPPMIYRMRNSWRCSLILMVRLRKCWSILH
jgi:hypothetical protein